MDTRALIIPILQRQTESRHLAEERLQKAFLFVVDWEACLHECSKFN